MKNVKRLLLAAVALTLAVALAGCSIKDVAASVVKKFVSSQSNGDEEEVPYRYAEAGGEVTLPEAPDFDPTERFSTLVQDGSLYLSFNNINYYWSTGYFYPQGESLTVTCYATTDSSGTRKYKIAVWELSEDGASAAYIPDTTVYFTPDGTTQTCTVSGLNPASQYKLVISYDSSYYISGALRADGVASDSLNEVD